MKLVIIRHAKSLYNNYVNVDSERHLAERGYGDIEFTAKWLLQREYYPNLIVSSPAIRAYSTAFIIANRVGYTSEIRLNNAIYEASSKTLLYVLNEIEDNVKTIYLVGHNPGFTDLVNLLCGNVISGFPTSAALVIEFKGMNSWASLGPKTGYLIEQYSNHKEIE